MSVAAALGVCKKKGWLEEGSQKESREEAIGEKKQAEGAPQGNSNDVDELEELFTNLLREERDEAARELAPGSKVTEGEENQAIRNQHQQKQQHVESTLRPAAAPTRGQAVAKQVSRRPPGAGDLEESQQQWKAFQSHVSPSPFCLSPSFPAHLPDAPSSKISFKVGRGSLARPKPSKPAATAPSPPQPGQTHAVEPDPRPQRVVPSHDVQSGHAAAGIINSAVPSAAQQAPRRPLLIVVDTNCFVDHLDDVEACLHTPGVAVVVPLVVASELDKLKLCGREGAQDGARRAVAWLTGTLKRGGNGGWFRAQESWEISPLVQCRCPDDAILSVAVYFAKEAPGASEGAFRMALATGDMNLRLKATMRGMRSEVLSTLLAVEVGRS